MEQFSTTVFNLRAIPRTQGDGKMNMNQVAIAYANDEQKAAIKKTLGLADADWIKDKVRAGVQVLGRHGEYVTGENVAELEFCMAMGGTQFELISYTSGPNWIAEAGRLGVAMPMVAHIGFHLDDGEEWPMVDGKLAQEAVTVEHSNEEVNKADRRYHYRIYRISPTTYFKFIRRITKQDVEDAMADRAAHEQAQLEQTQQPQPSAEQSQLSTQPGNDVAARPLPMGVDAAQAGLADPDHPQSDAATEASEQAIKDAAARAEAEATRRANDDRLRLEAAGVAAGGVDADDRPVGAATTENSPSELATTNEAPKEPQPTAAQPKPAPEPGTTYKGKGGKK
jgi:hypothetical protein